MTGKRLYWFPDISILLLIREVVVFNYLIICENRIDYRILASIFRITSVMVIFTDVTRYSFIWGGFVKKQPVSDDLSNKMSTFAIIIFLLSRELQIIITLPYRSRRMNAPCVFTDKTVLQTNNMLRHVSSVIAVC